ncbi:MAG: hypothetical protein ACTSRZ_08620 [Promethearchaeota archaeon]
MEHLTKEEKEKKADELINQAKKFISEKKYDDAILLYEEAIDLYRDLGWIGQVGILRKQIIKLESLKNIFAKEQIKEKEEKLNKFKMEKEADKLAKKAKNLAFMNKFEEAIENYEKVIKIYENLGYSFQIKRFLWEIEKIKDKMKKQKENQPRLDKQDNSILNDINQKSPTALSFKERAQLEKELHKKAEAEKIAWIEEKQKEKEKILEERRKKLEELKRKKESEFEKWINEQEIIHQAIQKENFEEEYKRLKQIEIKKLKRKKAIDEANKLLDEAKKYADNLQFEDAKKLYANAAVKFEEAGWKDQANLIRNEIGLLIEKEKQLKEKEKLKELEKIKKQKELEEIIQKKKQEELQKEIEKEQIKNQFSPEELKKIELAEFNIDKAKQEANKSKYEKAIKRLEYAHEILISIKKEGETITQNKIEEINKLIKIYKQNINPI